jgi:hypothetical protein
MAMAALAPLALLAILGSAGWAWAGRLASSHGERATLAVVAGAVWLHLALMAADLLGSAWSLTWVLAPALVAAAGGGLATRRWPAAHVPPGATPLERRLGWGDTVAAVAVAAFAALAWTRWITISDFIYHWGLKGHRFYLDRGVDYEYLARPWNWVVHPDYPNLLPELYAATALLAGAWSEPPMLVWSALFVGLLLLVARETLAAATLPPVARQVALATLGLALGAFGIGYRMAGAADWLLALALVAALPALLRPADAAGDVQVALCAAFAAGSKLEGLTLAAWLLLVQLLRRRPWRWRGLAAAALRLGLPVAAVALPWGAQVIRHELFQPFNTGSPELARALVAAPAVLQAALRPQWLGLPAALLLLPVLLSRPRVRAAALVAALQLATYLWQYQSAPLDTAFLVSSTFPRLALHLLPAVGVLAAVTWLGEGPPAPAGSERNRKSGAGAGAAVFRTAG